MTTHTKFIAFWALSFWDACAMSVLAACAFVIVWDIIKYTVRIIRQRRQHHSVHIH